MRRYDYLPFGQEILSGADGRTGAMGYAASPDNANPKFTGQTWDYETGLDYFNARYYSTAQGRFQSSDPANAGADPTTPQTWNGYGYVANSPLTLIDPSGQFLDAAGIGAATCGPICAGIGAAIDIGELFVGLLGFGGGGSAPPPQPTWTVTAYGQSSVQTAAPYSFSALGIGADATALVIPGLVFYAQATASAPPKTGIKTLNCAGYTASRSIFAQTKAQTIEFGGFIEKATNGTYSYTPPFAGNRTSLPSFYDQYNSLVQSLSKGVSVAGWYHSHPVPPPTYPSAEAFSGQDLSVSHYLNAPGFVVTPSGAVLRLNPGPPAVTTRVPSNVCQSGG